VDFNNVRHALNLKYFRIIQRDRTRKARVTFGSWGAKSKISRNRETLYSGPFAGLENWSRDSWATPLHDEEGEELERTAFVTEGGDITGDLEAIKRLVRVDQKAIGRTPARISRLTPASLITGAGFSANEGSEEALRCGAETLRRPSIRPPYRSPRLCSWA
jgi:hypothetical protein